MKAANEVLTQPEGKLLHHLFPEKWEFQPQLRQPSHTCDNAIDEPINDN